MNADWFYSLGETRQGPIAEDELRRLAASGQLKPNDLVWRDGMPDWVEARTVEALFPRTEAIDADDEDRPSRRRVDPVDRPSRRDEDYDDDRPSRRGRRDDAYEDEDRPRVRRSANDLDDDYDRPRRTSQKPGQIQAVGIMLLVGSILGLITMASVVLGSVFFCCLWPGVYFELIWAILAIIRGINMLHQDDQGPPRTMAILQIICIVNLDVINCVLGIVSLVMLNDPQVQAYYRKKGFAG